MNDMETQEWWRAKWYETPTEEFVEWVIAEAVSRRDAELLEEIDGMRIAIADMNMVDGEIRFNETNESSTWNAALENVKKLIKDK